MGVKPVQHVTKTRASHIDNGCYVAMLTRKVKHQTLPSYKVISHQQTENVINQLQEDRVLL